MFCSSDALSGSLDLIYLAVYEVCEYKTDWFKSVFWEKNVGPGDGSMVRKSEKTSLPLSNMEGLKESRGGETGEDGTNVKEIREQDSWIAGQFSKGDSKKAVLANVEV